MGSKLSVICCSCCATRVPTEESECLGIQNEIRQKKENMPFDHFLKRRNSFSVPESVLNFLENPQIDYLTTGNKIMQRSAILDIKEIPDIPPPGPEQFAGLPQRLKRSISVSIRNDKARRFYPLFLAKQTKYANY